MSKVVRYQQSPLLKHLLQGDWLDASIALVSGSHLQTQKKMPNDKNIQKMDSKKFNLSTYTPKPVEFGGAFRPKPASTSPELHSPGCQRGGPLPGTFRSLLCDADGAQVRFTCHRLGDFCL